MAGDASWITSVRPSSFTPLTKRIQSRHNKDALGKFLFTEACVHVVRAESIVVDSYAILQNWPTQAYSA
jgi:hypothetical protein